MSDYNIQVTWSGKDSLADSDPDKVISGGDFNTEFTAVKTAINSKANINGDASNDFSATTQVAGNSTTKVATTAFVDAANKAFAETVVDKSGSFSADKTEGTVYDITGAVTITVPSASSSYSGVYFVFSYSAPPTFSGTLLWKGGSAPTLTGRGIVTIFCDAHRWLAVRTSDNMS
jgi:transglutaminase/protease-like cytokinesis protein 3